MQKWGVDENYIPTLQIKLEKGRNFSTQLASDSNSVIINQSAAKFIGPDNPLGKQLFEISDIQSKTIRKFHIIGVVKNFHFNSLHEQVTPLALSLRRESGSVALRISTPDISRLLQQKKEKWNTIVPSQPLSYSFMDEQFNNQYRAEQRIGKISIAFSTLAIFIACLGLFGLVTYAAEQRIKEIEIRKILGAGIPNVIHLLSKDFIKLVLIAMLIAAPIASWTMNKWLQDFAYHINLSWWVFLEAGSVGIFIALATIGYRAVKAAIDNPVKSLRTE